MEEVRTVAPLLQLRHRLPRVVEPEELSNITPSMSCRRGRPAEGHLSRAVMPLERTRVGEPANGQHVAMTISVGLPAKGAAGTLTVLEYQGAL